MKKVILVLSVVAAVVLTASCNSTTGESTILQESSTCKCTVTAAGESSTVEVANPGKCSDLNSSAEYYGIKTTTTCVSK